MTRAFRTSVILWLLCVGAPSRASASIMDWLDRLSGPGPFWGVDFDMQVNCPSRAASSLAEGNRFKVVAANIVISCPDERFDQRHFSWYLTPGLGWTRQLNGLGKVSSSDLDATKAIGTVKLGTAIDYTVAPAVDIGAGGGFLYFYGPRFVNFARPYVQPFRVAVRPGLFKPGASIENTSSTWRGAFVINFSVTVIVGTIDGSDFGVPANPWRVHNEFVPEAGISLDVLRPLFTRR
jgi:hypothetical protein